MLLNKLWAKFLDPQNVGKCVGENAIARNASVICGANLRLSLRINEETQSIEQAKFHALGCHYLIATVEILCARLEGKNIKKAFAEFPAKVQRCKENSIENEIVDLPENRRHCLNLCLETLRIAINDFSVPQIESWNGDEALICTCFGVSEREIERVVGENLCETVEDVTKICNAGGGCGSCQPLIAEIINDRRRELF